jgi:hypothetical protein
LNTRPSHPGDPFVAPLDFIISEVSAACFILTFDLIDFRPHCREMLFCPPGTRRVPSQLKITPATQKPGFGTFLAHADARQNVVNLKPPFDVSLHGRHV